MNDGKDGYLVEAENIHQLSDKINELIKDKAKIEEIGKQAIINSDRFNIKSIVKRWEMIINQ